MSAGSESPTLTIHNTLGSAWDAFSSSTYVRIASIAFDFHGIGTTVITIADQSSNRFFQGNMTNANRDKQLTIGPFTTTNGLKIQPSGSTHVTITYFKD